MVKAFGKTVLAGMVAATFLVGCDSGSKDTPIKLGVIAPLSGGGTSYGLGIKQGAEMAVEEINAAGGVNGRKINLVVVDDASDPAQSVTAMKRLVDNEKVDVIVGGWGSSQVLAHQGTVEKEGVPYVIVGATNPKITKEGNKWSFRVIQTDSIQSVEIAEAAVKKLNLKKIAVIFDSNDYGTGNKEVFVKHLKSLGVDPVAMETFKTNDKDFIAQLSKIKEAQPDGIAVFGTIPAAPAIMSQARGLGITARFIGTGGLANEQLMELGRQATEGTVLTTYFHEDSDAEAGAWGKRYTAKYTSGASAPRPVLAAWEYRTISQIVAPVLKTAGSDKEKIRAGLESFNGKVFGVADAVSFDKSHQLVQRSVLVEVKDGKFALFSK
ncbi:ABC transporter substrate-binding protein [Lacisediminimonas profundi]|uniref:ABC transporter substrate-binding protein n=1 Tax=Lacisediminimonas profundi TaxID=2603856 RepID=UPI00138709A1|nr:ABC transporter substrate-binding protein [Lacisediminimonas profundi]